MNKMRNAVAALAALGMVVATPTMAEAHGKTPREPHVSVVSTAVAAPFNLEVSRHDVLVADGGLNLIGKLARDGSIKPVATDQAGASGVAVSRVLKAMAFTTTVTDPATYENSESGLNIWGPHGHKTYADTHAFEVKHNPDKVNHYGVTNPSPCVTDALTAAGLPVSYTGGVDSHAYSVTSYRDGWIVADAGANVLWKVDRRGHISTLAVLPPQPLKITEAQAGALGLPSCVVGVTYNFEPVPTDVEVGNDGRLYVTTLPGGPESPVLGARGSLYRMDASGRHMKVVATGFLGATNLALAPNCDIYVAEFFAGKISLVHKGKVSTFVELPGVVAVETSGSSVWAATMGDEQSHAPGTIVKITGHR
ncbi:MAG: ScyD/ScyE family protein [Arachnia sp.]